jgi:hypothetical protein
MIRGGGGGFGFGELGLDLRSEVGVVGEGMEEGSWGAVPSGGWRVGLAVPLWPSAIACKIVWSGRWGSQLSSHSAVGVNCVLVVKG